MVSKINKLALGFLVVLSILLAIPSVAAAEPDLDDILSDLGFTSIFETSIQTFPAGSARMSVH